MKDVGLARLDPLEAERAHRLDQDGRSGDDRGSSVGVQTGDVLAGCSGSAASIASIRSHSLERQLVAVYAQGVVGLELLVDRRERGGRAGHGDALSDAHRAHRPARRPRPSREPTRHSAAISSALGGSLATWRSLKRTDPMRVDTWKSGVVARRADHVLGASAADVDHQRRARRRVASGRGAEERQAGFLLAADGADVEPEAVADRRLELLAVGGIAHGARGHRDRPLGPVLVRQARGRPPGVRRPAPSRRRRACPPRRRPRQAGSHRCAGRSPRSVPLLVDVGNEQPGRVRAQIHHGYAPTVIHAVGGR